MPSVLFPLTDPVSCRLRAVKPPSGSARWKASGLFICLIDLRNESTHQATTESLPQPAIIQQNTFTENEDLQNPMNQQCKEHVLQKARKFLHRALIVNLRINPNSKFLLKWDGWIRRYDMEPPSPDMELLRYECRRLINRRFYDDLALRGDPKILQPYYTAAVGVAQGKAIAFVPALDNTFYHDTTRLSDAGVAILDEFERGLAFAHQLRDSMDTWGIEYGTAEGTYTAEHEETLLALRRDCQHIFEFLSRGRQGWSLHRLASSRNHCLGETIVVASEFAELMRGIWLELGFSTIAAIVSLTESIVVRLKLLRKVALQKNAVLWGLLVARLESEREDVDELAALVERVEISGDVDGIMDGMAAISVEELADPDVERAGHADNVD